MENLKWRILPLWNEERLAEALEDMEMAGRQAQAMKFRHAKCGIAENRMSVLCGDSKSKNVLEGLSIRTAQAVQCNITKLWTPVETPSSSLETGRQCGGSSGRDMLILDTRTASFDTNATRDQEILLSPRSCVREPFPLYTEPILGSGE